MNAKTTKPVTTGGWYEHEDGTVGLYTWRAGQLCLDQTAPSWDAIPERDYAAEDRASRQVPS